MLSCLDTVLQHVVVEKIQHENLQGYLGVQMAKNIISDERKTNNYIGFFWLIFVTKIVYLILDNGKWHDTKTHI